MHAHNRRQDQRSVLGFGVAVVVVAVAVAALVAACALLSVVLVALDAVHQLLAAGVSLLWLQVNYSMMAILTDHRYFRLRAHQALLDHALRMMSTSKNYMHLWLFEQYIMDDFLESREGRQKYYLLGLCDIQMENIHCTNTYSLGV